jgi:hypothetical protein
VQRRLRNIEDRMIAPGSNGLKQVEPTGVQPEL